MNPTRVLLADDHALLRAGIRNALENNPSLNIVGEVGDGVALMQALKAEQPDLLLIDIAMPQFEPIKAVRQIRQLYPSLRILVVSAHDDDVYVQGMLREGVNGYHLKDQPLSDLQLAVEQVLAGHRWICTPLVEKLLHPADPPPPTLSLSSRQLDILHLLAKGLDNKAISAHLNISVKTVETHLTRLYRHLNVQSRLEAARYAHEHPQIMNHVIHNAAAPNQPLSTADRQVIILIVDDNKRYRQQLKRMIGRIYPQAAVYEAQDSGEATQFTQQFAPKIALVDVVLGDESGIHCTRLLKKQLPHLRVVLMSAYPDREFHRRGLEAGANAFLDKKDLDTSTLFQIISDAIA